jgi:hypothetical protein
MTIEITIPIFETFWALDPSLRTCIALAILAATFFGVMRVAGGIDPMNPFTWGWILLTIGSMAFGFTYLIHAVVESAPENFNLFILPNITLPITIRVT